jgi:predicted MFS family arabinose efflux permease
VKNNLRWMFILTAVIYLSQGLGGLPSLAFTFYLKETLGFDEQKLMYIGSMIGLAWLVKPILGMIITSFLTKRAWIIISLLTTIAVSCAFGFVSSLPIVIGLMILLSTAGAFRDVATDGLSCVIGKKYDCTGKLQSVAWGAITVASILTGFVGGWLSEFIPFPTIYLTLIPFYVIILGVVSRFKEDTDDTPKVKLFEALKELAKDKNMLLVCVFLFLYSFSPSIGTPLFYIQRDVFGWSRTWIGMLGTIGAAASVLGTLWYYHYSKRLDLKLWLTVGVFINVVCTLCYLYFTPITCVIYDIVFSVISIIFTLLTLDFMARTTKPGMESISFALLCSITNLAGTCNGFVGGYLFPIVGLKWLIIISAFSSLLCLPLIRRLKV